jgi:DNA ligase-1
MILEKLKQLVDELNTTNKTNDKIEVLKKYNNDEEVKNILVRIYSPYIHFGVGSKNCKKLSHLCYSDDTHTLEDLLDDLSNRVYTGHDAISLVNAFILANKQHADLIYNILDKDLKTRTAASLINKAIPYLIPQFKVALAETMTSYPDISKEPWLLSRKLDGVRCIIRKEHDEINAYSRSGKEFTTLQKVLDEVSQMPGDFVLDGELCIVDENGNENFQDVMKEIRRKNHTIENPKLFIFDYLTLEEFDTQVGTKTLVERLCDSENYNLGFLEGCKYLENLPQYLVNTTEFIESETKKAEEAGYEGVMLRRNCGYKGKRSKDILKVKKFHDAEYKVVGATNGDIRVIEDGVEKTINCLSNITIMHKGTQVGVGSGFSIDQRKEFGKDHHKILGKLITVQYFEESQNQNGEWSLRFPVLKYIYNGERDC